MRSRFETTKTKVHNASDAQDAKVDLRRRVLEVVRPARVFDCFCGPDGEMWRGAWRNAEQYVGCDVDFRWGDPRARFVGDTYTVMRALDLQAWNVFDVDTFGCPWTAMLIIAARRRWKSGEVGAVVITDGASLHTRFNGITSRAFAQAAGIVDGKMPGTLALHKDARTRAIQRWMATCQVAPLNFWQASGNGSGKGASRMTYLALVFRGV